MTPARGAGSAALVALLGLAACAEPVTAFKPLTVDAARAASVGVVSIVNQSADATTKDLTALQAALLEASSRCATGPNRYDMIVQVQNFRHGNWRLVSLPYTVTARLVLIDPAQPTVEATYWVEADGPGTFANRVCREVFDAAN